VAPNRNVRFGSKADITAVLINVRFTPKSGLSTGLFFLRLSSRNLLSIFCS